MFRYLLTTILIAWLKLLMGQKNLSLEYISIFADYQYGQVSISVTGAQGSTTLNYYDYSKLSPALQRQFKRKPYGWRRVHMLEVEDRRWEIQVIEQLVSQGWKVEQQDFSLAMASQFTETLTQVDREMRNTYLLSRPTSLRVPPDTLMVSRGDITGDTLPETVAVIQNAELALLNGDLTRYLVVTNAATEQALLNSGAVPAYFSASGESDPLKGMEIIDGKLSLTMQVQGTRRINTYVFSLAGKRLALERIVFGGEILHSNCYFSSDMTLNYLTGRITGRAQLVDCRNSRTAPRNVSINEEVPNRESITLQNFVFGGYKSRLRKYWRADLIY